MQPLRVEVPDLEYASSLRSYLQLAGVETVTSDGCCEVLVDLVAHNPESRIVNTLNAIEKWLLAAGLPFVQVHVSGNSYRLHTSAAATGGMQLEADALSDLESAWQAAFASSN